MLRDVFSNSRCVKPWQGEIKPANQVKNHFVISLSGQYALDFVVGDVFDPNNNALITDFEPFARLIMNYIEVKGILNQIFECSALTIADNFAQSSSEFNELEAHFIDMGAISKRQLLASPNRRRYP